MMTETLIRRVTRGATSRQLTLLEQCRKVVRIVCSSSPSCQSPGFSSSSSSASSSAPSIFPPSSLSSSSISCSFFRRHFTLHPPLLGIGSSRLQTDRSGLRSTPTFAPQCRELTTEGENGKVDDDLPEVGGAGAEASGDGDINGDVTSAQAEQVTRGGRTFTPRKKRKRLTRAQKGSYDESFEAELDTYKPEITGPVYDARGIVDERMKYDVEAELKKLLEHPTFEGLVPDCVPTDEPEEGEEGPRLRWQTRLVIGPGGQAWHPANRKVKVSVYVRELELSPAARAHLIALVGPRYDAGKDELTIVSERYRYREENRKDVLRILYALLEEAKKADHLEIELSNHVDESQVLHVN